MKKLKPVVRSLVLFGACAGAGYFAGGWLGTMLKRGAPAAEPLAPWSIALIPFLLFGVLAAHEFGHVVGGWAAGFVTWFYAAGPIRLERENDRLSLRFNREPALWGGIAAMAPPPGQTVDPASLPGSMLRVVAGGPLASLLLALLLVPGFLLRTESRTLAFVFLSVGSVSLAIAVATLLPHRTGGFVSDGARILQLLRGGPNCRLWCATAAVVSLGSTLRPRDWPPSLASALHEPGDPHDEVSARWLLHSWHFDRREWDEAEAALNQALDGVSRLAPSMRPLIHASAAWHFALRNNAAAARAHFEQAANSSFLKPGDRVALEAAVFAAEGRSAESLDSAARAESLLRSRPDLQAALYRELLVEIGMRSAPAQLAS